MTENVTVAAIEKGETTYEFTDGYSRNLRDSQLPNPGILASDTELVERTSERTGEIYVNEVAASVIELTPPACIRLHKEFREHVLAIRAEAVEGIKDAKQAAKAAQQAAKDAFKSFQFTVTPAELTERTEQALQRAFGVGPRPSQGTHPALRNPIIGLDVDEDGERIDPTLLLLDITFAKTEAAENGYASGEFVGEM